MNDDEEKTQPKRSEEGTFRTIVNDTTGDGQASEVGMSGSVRDQKIVVDKLLCTRTQHTS